MKIFLILLVITLGFQSCVLHSSAPLICFSKKCVQSKKQDRAISMKAKKRQSKPKSNKTKGSAAKKNILRKEENVIKNDRTKDWKTKTYVLPQTGTD